MVRLHCGHDGSKRRVIRVKVPGRRSKKPFESRRHRNATTIYSLQSFWHRSTSGCHLHNSLSQGPRVDPPVSTCCSGRFGRSSYIGNRPGQYGVECWVPWGASLKKHLSIAVQNIQTNKVGCVSLARRAAQILVDIDHQMRGRWDSAPERLVQNLQKFEG